MAQRFVQIMKGGGKCKIMIGGVEAQRLQWSPKTAYIGILQTRSKTVKVGADIEKVHSAIELVMGSIDRAKALEDFVLSHSDSALGRYSKIFITAQVVIAYIETVVGCWNEGDLATHHPGVNLHGLLVFTELAIVGSLDIPILGVKPESMLHALEKYDIYVSTKSACSSNDDASEAVYHITGNLDQAKSSIRISLSHLTTSEEIETFKKAFRACYEELACLK